MKLLALETSCDETAVAVFDFHSETEFTILSEQLNSQIDIHKEYGGVFPAIAKREHTKNIYPLLIASLQEAGLLKKRLIEITLTESQVKKMERILERDPENLELLITFHRVYEIPDIHVIAVTYGPGLEMALWTGFNFARALAAMWNATLVPTNHMEGHIYASLIKQTDRGTMATPSFRILNPGYPNLSLLISGGHTELLVSNSEHQYEKIGHTLDDAVGEAYDKSARLIGISYPGGPEISKLADTHRLTHSTSDLSLPRPMLYSKNYNFSFSGLKTAVRTLVENQEKLTDDFKQELSFELEESIAEVLIKKTRSAIIEYGVNSLIVGGGVSANNHLRSVFTNLCEQEKITLFLSDKKYTGDNAVMIGIAGYKRFISNNYDLSIEHVSGRLSLEENN